MKAAKRRVSNDFLTIKGKYMIRAQTSIQSLGGDFWSYYQTWRYADILSGIRNNCPQFTNLCNSYEFVRLVSAKIKVLGTLNPLRSETSFGTSVIAVDPKPTGTFPSSTVTVMNMVNQHNFCKVRPFPQSNSMKIRAIPFNCKQTDMAIWQNSTGTNWYTDFKTDIAPPEYRCLIEVNSATYRADYCVGYVEISYRLQFKNLRKFNLLLFLR